LVIVRFWLLNASLLFAAPAMADVSVTAAVDQSRVAFGESVTVTITVNGTHSGPQPAIPRVEGLTFAGPSVNTSVSIVNATMSQSVSLVYQITPTRAGEFTIPAIPITVAGKVYQTDPIKLTVVQGAVQPDTQQLLFLKVQVTRQQVYLGETAPLNILLFTRVDQEVKGLGGFTFEADGLGYKFLQNPKSGRQVINGETFNVYMIEGAISPTRVGQLAFGPCAIKVHLAAPRKRRGGFGDDFFDDFFGRSETREVPVTSNEVPIDVLPLPEEGKPADFTRAVGQWNLDQDAKPAEVAVGDPITVTIKIAGNGNIDTVSTPALKGLEKFKAYDPSSKTTKNELSTTGERLFQQVLVPKSTEATELPGVRLSYFDPVTKTYQTVERGAIKLQVKAGSGGASAIVSGGMRSHPSEKLGEDIVYLKGDPGPVASQVSWELFWGLNLAPMIALAGAVGWKRRTDRLCRDVAFARRSRAARAARKLLTAAASFDGVQQALQSYLGDRLNIPASGITASVVEEHGLPKDVAGVFELCDAARFAGAPADLAGSKQTVERVIDELENATL
jgi:hypothetical protein